MLLSTFSNTYSDELITATELDDQTWRVLDKAYEHPVTITRQDQYFALLRREDVAYLINGIKQSKTVCELLSVAYCLLIGKNINYEHQYRWLKVFDQDELKDFIQEINEVFLLNDTSDNTWELLEAIIYEWKESAIAISSPDLAFAFNDETDEIPLTPHLT
ncbi:MAG TPA: hypothetical protein V6C58_06475 [Allocoleopsis sp.]